MTLKIQDLHKKNWRIEDASWQLFYLILISQEVFLPFVFIIQKVFYSKEDQTHACMDPLIVRSQSSLLQLGIPRGLRSKWVKLVIKLRVDNGSLFKKKKENDELVRVALKMQTTEEAA